MTWLYTTYIYIYTFTVWHVFELDTHKRPCMVGYCLIPDGCTETSSLWAGGISRCDWCDWLKGHGVGIGQNTCTPQPCNLHKSLMIFLFRWNMLPSWQPTCPNAISKIWRWFPFPKMGYVSYDIDLWFVKWEGNLDMLHAESTFYNHPPWNEQSAPENGWLEDEFPFGTAYFQRRNVSFREGSKIMQNLCLGITGTLSAWFVDVKPRSCFPLCLPFFISRPILHEYFHHVTHTPWICRTQQTTCDQDVGLVFDLFVMVNLITKTMVQKVVFFGVLTFASRRGVCSPTTKPTYILSCAMFFFHLRYQHICWWTINN